MSWQKQIVAISVGMVWASTVLSAAGQPSKLGPLGYLAAQGNVWIDRQAAPSGTTVFAGDVITTGKSSLASVKLASGAQATLGENSELAVASGEFNAPMRLVRGAIAVRNPSEQAAHFGVGGTTVVLRSENGFPAICRIAYVGGTPTVTADGGRIEVRRRGVSTLLLRGKSFRLEAGMPQAAGQLAGKITNLIPQGTVQHPGQANQNPLKVSDPIVWEDTVRTLNTGRVRIGLNDGSVLNVGVRSTMRIVKHDGQSQQTEIEMQLGKLRGQVVKLSKPGSSFQIRTQTAVIGVVGTILAVTASATNTHVVCIEGMLNVKSNDPGVPGEQNLGPGQQTNVPKGMPPSSPTAIGPAGIADELNATNAGEVPAPEFGKFGEIQFPKGPPPVGPTGVPPVGPAVNAAAAAGAGASAVLGGVALQNASDAQNNAAAAELAAGEAQSNASDASDAATGAANAANAFVNGLQDYLDSLSPGGGGCACIP
jgi:ferric-dicitrate binding protein FerR (iron transport regulator)